MCPQAEGRVENNVSFDSSSQARTMHMKDNVAKVNCIPNCAGFCWYTMNDRQDFTSLFKAGIYYNLNYCIELENETYYNEFILYSSAVINLHTENYIR